MRYTSEHLPKYAHRPGKTTHPNKEGGHSFGKDEPDQNELTKENFVIHHEYLFGIDLYNQGYFWESHVYWEAAWNGCQRQGQMANYLKSLILLAAARLKSEIGQPKPALGHIKRSLELLNEIEHQDLAGMDLNQLKENLHLWVSSADELSQKLSQHSLTLIVE